MTNNLIKTLLDNVSIEYPECSYALIGCARWGGVWWGEKPDISKYSEKIHSFSKLVFKFAKDYNQGDAYLLSNLVRVNYNDWDKNDISLFLNKNRDFFESDTFEFMISKNIMRSQKGSQLIDEHELPFHLITHCSQDYFYNMVKFFFLIPSLYHICMGTVFIMFKSYIIELTWHGWVVYAKREADIEFVRWFFTLVNEICNLSPSLLIASRDPLLDDYLFD